MSPSPDVSIIIISYNTQAITSACLDSIFISLKNAAFTWEIVVVDNASPDDSAAMLEKYRLKHPDHIQLICNSENTGFGAANNQAVKKSRGRYLLLLNSDTIIRADAIGTMHDYYLKNKDTVQFLGCRLLNKDNTHQPSAAPFFTLPVIFAFLFLKGDKIGLTRWSPNTVRRVGWVSGACIYTTREYYDMLGGFDEGIFMYMEEVDLMYRGSLRGWHTYYIPNAEITHLGSASSNKTYPILQAYRGFIYFYKKHYNSLALYILVSMLKLKAVIAIVAGYITHNSYLTETYVQAYNVAQVD